MYMYGTENKPKKIRQHTINMSDKCFLQREKYRRKHRNYLIDNQSISLGACDSEKNDYRFDK